MAKGSGGGGRSGRGGGYQVNLTGSPSGDAQAFLTGIPISQAKPSRITITSSDGGQQMIAYAYRPTVGHNPMLSVRRVNSDGKPYREFYTVSLKGRDAGKLTSAGRATDSALRKRGRDLKTGGLIDKKGVLVRRKVKGGVKYTRITS